MFIDSLKLLGPIAEHLADMLYVNNPQSAMMHTVTAKMTFEL